MNGYLQVHKYMHLKSFMQTNMCLQTIHSLCLQVELQCLGIIPTIASIYAELDNISFPVCESSDIAVHSERGVNTILFVTLLCFCLPSHTQEGDPELSNLAGLTVVSGIPLSEFRNISLVQLLLCLIFFINKFQCFIFST